MRGFDQLRKSLCGSEAVVVLMPLSEIDAKISMEVGLAVFLGKPIVALTRPGVKVSGKLASIVDHFIEFDPHRPDAVAKALHEFLANRAASGKDDV